MKNTITILSLILVLAFAPQAFAQTTTTQTTIATAVTTTTQQQVCVASTTGMSASTASAQYFLFSNRELMRINAVNSTSNCLTVTRGVGGIATRHNLFTPVFYGQGGSRFDAATGNVVGPGPFITNGTNRTPIGTCVPADNSFLPVINTANGDVAQCLTTFANGTDGNSGLWQVNNYAQYASNQGVTNVNDAAYTALLTDTYINYTYITATRILTLPSISGNPGKVFIIRNNGPGSATITVTGSVGQAIGSPTGSCPAPATCGALTLSNTGSGTITRLISLVATHLGSTVNTNRYYWGTF